MASVECQRWALCRETAVWLVGGRPTCARCHHVLDRDSGGQKISSQDASKIN